MKQSKMSLDTTVELNDADTLRSLPFIAYRDNISPRTIVEIEKSGRQGISTQEVMGQCLANDPSSLWWTGHIYTREFIWLNRKNSNLFFDIIREPDFHDTELLKDMSNAEIYTQGFRYDKLYDKIYLPSKEILSVSTKDHIPYKTVGFMYSQTGGFYPENRTVERIWQYLLPGEDPREMAEKIAKTPVGEEQLDTKGKVMRIRFTRGCIPIRFHKGNIMSESYIGDTSNQVMISVPKE